MTLAAKPVSTVIMIKKYLEHGENGRKVEVRELREFKESLAPGEADVMAATAAVEMGYTKNDEGKYEPPDSV